MIIKVWKLRFLSIVFQLNNGAGVQPFHIQLFGGSACKTLEAAGSLAEVMARSLC